MMYKTKQRIVDAIQVNDFKTCTLQKVSDFTGLECRLNAICDLAYLSLVKGRDNMVCMPGDFIVRDGNGEITVVGEEKFSRMYEEV